VQAYLVGVLSHLPSSHLTYFKDLILHTAFEEAGWNNKHITLIGDIAVLIWYVSFYQEECLFSFTDIFCFVCRSSQQSPQKKEYLLTLLKDLVAHVSSEVRYAAAKLLSQMVSFITIVDSVLAFFQCHSVPQPQFLELFCLMLLDRFLLVSLRMKSLPLYCLRY
jgi:hypothetical protein